jgi:hypothetical protein
MTYLATIIANNPNLRQAFEEYAPNKQAVIAFVKGNRYFQISILLEFLNHHHISILQIPFGTGMWIVPALIHLNYADPLNYTAIGFKPHTINEQQVYIYRSGSYCYTDYIDRLEEEITVALQALNKLITNKIMIDDDIPF